MFSSQKRNNFTDAGHERTHLIIFRFSNFTAVSSLGAFLDMHDAMGNPTHPFLAPEVFVQNPVTADASFLQRLNGLLYNIWYRALYKYEFIPRMDKIVKKYLGDNQPSISESQSKVALLLITVNPIIDVVRPNIPTVINIEQLHIDDPKPLPKVRFVF